MRHEQTQTWIKRAIRLAGLATTLALAAPAFAGEGDPQKGVRPFRDCAACHTLVEGLHTTGPSLAGLFERPAGTAEGFVRYSPNLKDAGFEWNLETLDSFLAEPQQMVPGTFMDIPGMWDARARADLIAFLEIALAPGGGQRAVELGLIEEVWLRGVAPKPIGEASPATRISEIRHCGDSFFITTADGTQEAFWEKNVRIKIDSAETGPPQGVPVLIESGRMGDRTYVIFRSLDDLRTLIAEKC
jgi:cytochrome c